MAKPTIRVCMDAIENLEVFKRKWKARMNASECFADMEAAENELRTLRRNLEIHIGD